MAEVGDKRSVDVQALARAPALSQPVAAPRVAPGRSRPSPVAAAEPAGYRAQLSGSAVGQSSAPKTAAAFAAPTRAVSRQQLDEALKHILSDAAARGTTGTLVDLDTHCLERSHVLGTRLEALGIPVQRMAVFHHAFLTVATTEGERIVDPTYRQFLKGTVDEPRRAGMAPVYVGTRDGLVDLYRASGFTDADKRVDRTYGFATAERYRRPISRERGVALVDTP